MPLWLSLVATAFLMGLAGGPHCVAMCGAATAGIGCTRQRLLRFQIGRIAGYAVAGALVASSVGVLGWAASHLTVLKPFWAMLHVALVALGLSLLWLGRQPAWLDRASHRAWQAIRIRTLHIDPDRLPLAAGALWALLPCGLLYSGLMVASLAPGAWQGGLVMAAFAAGSAISLQVGPALWQRFMRRPVDAGSGRLGVRVAGLAVAAASAWALGHGLWHEYQRIFC
jgi:sulfite exporter TauE/SafE